MVVPIPTFPLWSITKRDEVAESASLEVPSENLPSTFERSQCLLFVDASVSVSAIYGEVDATWKSQYGVVVPTASLLPVLR